MTSMNIVVSLKLTFIHVFPLHTSLQHPTRLVLPSIQTSWFIDDAVPISRLDNETLKRLITPLPILMQNQPARYSLPAHAIRTPFSLPLPALLKIPSWDLATRQHLGKSDVSSDASALLHAISSILASASSHSRPRFSA